MKARISRRSGTRSVRWLGVVITFVMMALAVLVPFNTVAVAASVVTATVFTDAPLPVPASGCSVTGVAPCSLREAVVFANKNPGTTIALASGTYTLSLPPVTTDSADSGDLNLTANVTITGGSGATVIDGGGMVPRDRVFHVHGGIAATLSGLTITNGQSTSDLGGGGILNQGNLTLTNVTISGNSASIAPGGGGIYNSGTMVVTNSTISGNAAPNSSGGIFNTHGPVTFTNVTVANNGTGINPSGNPANITLQNTIVADGCAAAVTSVGYNLDSGTSCGMKQADDLSGVNPLLGSLQLNAPGTTATHALRSSSPAIDRIPVADCPATDQRGVARPVPHGGLCDIGAYEAAAVTPTISRISVSAGPISGGTSVTITGAGFRPGATVSFGSAAATNVVVVGDTQITATTPPSAAGVVAVAVANPGGLAATLAGAYTYAGTVSVSRITPSGGLTTGGTAVTIVGAGFQTGTTVTIGGIPATGVAVPNTTTITATTPAGAAGAADVVATNPGGLSATLPASFTYAVPTAPTISAVNPATGPITGGTSVAITGTGFQAGATVTIGASACTTITVATSTINCTTPAGTVGSADVTVTNPGALSGTLASGFIYAAAPPSISGVSPASGPIVGGTPIVVSGRGFVLGATVTIGGSACGDVAVFNGGKTISCTTPGGTAGTVNVLVQNPDGQNSGGARFTYSNAAGITIATVAPTSGPVAGGTPITITGTNFQTGVTVTVGGIPCTNVARTDATTLTCTTPAGTAGVVDIVVTNPDASIATATSVYTFGATTATAITLTPTSGPPSGGTSVTLTGPGLAAGTTVTIGGNACSGGTVGVGSLTCITPVGVAGTVDVVVTNPGAPVVMLAGGFTYVAPVAPVAPAPPPVAPAFVPIAPVTDSSTVQFFTQTGHSISFGFKAYWNAHGGLRLLGYPISQEFQEQEADGQTRTVQYFERARFEYHPEFKGTPNEIELGLLAVEMAHARAGESPFHRAAAFATTATKRWFAESGHGLDSTFKKYWDQNGALPVFGLPISNPFDELNAADGKIYSVQYLERERFEYHPEFAGTPNEVLLGLLGKEIATQRGYLPRSA